MLAILQPSAPSPPWPLASQGESRLLMPSGSSPVRSAGAKTAGLLSDGPGIAPGVSVYTQTGRGLATGCFASS